MADRGEEERCAGGRKWSRMAEGLQMQEMTLKWQAVRNLNLNMKAMESNRRVSHHGLLWKAPLPTLGRTD